MSAIHSLIPFIQAKGVLGDYDKDLSSCIPLHFKGCVVNIDDDFCYVKWQQDSRSFKKLEKKIADFLGSLPMDSIDHCFLENSKCYIMKSNKYSGRCQVLKSLNRDQTLDVLMVDQGIVLKNVATAVFYHQKRFFVDEWMFPLVLALASPDDRQMAGLDLKPGFGHLVCNSKMSLDVYVLSACSPHYAVVGIESVLKSAILSGFDEDVVKNWNEMYLHACPSPVPLYFDHVYESQYPYGEEPVVVTVAGREDANKFYVFDLVNALRLCILTRYLGYYRTNDCLREATAVNSIHDLKVGQVVVVFDEQTQKMMRASVVSFRDGCVNTRGVDLPDRFLYDVDISDIFYVSSSFENVDALVYSVPLNDFKDFSLFANNWMASYLIDAGGVAVYERRNDCQPSLSIVFRGEIEDVRPLFEESEALSLLDEDEDWPLEIERIPGINLLLQAKEGINLAFMERLPFDPLPVGAEKIQLVRFDFLSEIICYHQRDADKMNDFYRKMSERIGNDDLRRINLKELRNGIGYWVSPELRCRVKRVGTGEELVMNDYGNDTFTYSDAGDLYVCDELLNVFLDKFRFSKHKFDATKAPPESLMVLIHGAEDIYLDSQGQTLYAEYVKQTSKIYYDLFRCYEFIAKELADDIFDAPVDEETEANVDEGEKEAPISNEHEAVENAENESIFLEDETRGEIVDPNMPVVGGEAIEERDKSFPVSISDDEGVDSDKNMTATIVEEIQGEAVDPEPFSPKLQIEVAQEAKTDSERKAVPKMLLLSELEGEAPKNLSPDDKQGPGKTVLAFFKSAASSGATQGV